MNLLQKKTPFQKSSTPTFQQCLVQTDKGFNSVKFLTLEWLKFINKLAIAILFLPGLKKNFCIFRPPVL